MNRGLRRLLRLRRSFLRLLRRRPISGTTFSVLAHGLVFALVLWLGLPMANVTPRRGEPLFVELPQIPAPAPRGNPAARERGPDVAPELPRASPPPRAATPPAPRSPAPRVAAAPPAPKPAPPAPPRPAERPAPPTAERPVPREPIATPALPAPSPPPQETRAPQPAAAPPPPAPPAPPAPAETPAARGDPAVAALPRESGPGRSVSPDMRSALRRGGAGGLSDGRGGIEGEPIPLDSQDPKYSDYLDRVRALIKSKWIYPCVSNPVTRQCEYKSAQLEIEFGIAKDGRVPFVIVRQPSAFGIYDDFAVNAIKLASPFPPVPDELGKKGIPILARFNYILESTSLTNLLR
jgi:outer membrane biosynthesis protein TonB